MLRLLVVSTLVAASAALSDVYRACISDNDANISNDQLLGTWYMVYKFTLFGGLVPSMACTTLQFSKPTADELQEYKKKYDGPSQPYDMNDNPVIIDNSWYKGMVMGHTEAKFYVLDPNNAMVVSGGYKVDVYRRIDDQYMLYWECSLRGSTRWLLSRSRDVSEEELLRVIASRPEISTMGSTRQCAT